MVSSEGVISGVVFPKLLVLLRQKMKFFRAPRARGALRPYSGICILRALSMPKPDSLQGSLDLLILKILSRRPGLHGYALMMAIQEISEEVLRVEEGSIYPALHRLEEAGHVTAKWVTREDTGRRARMYDLTAQGRKQLALEEDRWQAVTAAVNRVLRMA